MFNLRYGLLMFIGLTSVACSSVPDRSIAATGRTHTYVSDASGFDTKTFFYEGDSEIVAIDAQFTPELAEASIQSLRQHTQKPIKYLIITHPNPDKFNGASVFKKYGAKVIASKATADAIPGTHAYKKAYFVGAKMFTNETYPAQATVDETFVGTKTLTLAGGEQVNLRELSSPGVSSTQTVVSIPSEKALFVGDLVHQGVHAWLEGGIVNGVATPSIAGWIKDLKEIRSLYPKTTVFGGRGEAVKIENAVQNQVAYLKSADIIVRAYAVELKTSGSKPDFARLQKSFETKFPNYGLSYLIQYGSYGLLNSVSK